MKYDNLNGYRSIDDFVEGKLKRMNGGACDFAGLFDLMFSEKDNILYERSEGYRICKTTYGEAYACAKNRAAKLRALLPNAPHNAVIGIHMENSVQWIETFWAVLAAGFCPLLMNLRLDPTVLATALRDCEAVAVIADKGAFSIQTILQEELDGEAAPIGTFTFGKELFVMSTGTSSSVKVCGYGAEELSHLVSDSYSLIKTCPQIKKHYKGQLKLLTILPFYHVFGLIAMYIWFAFFSRTFVHLQDMEPQTILNTIRRHEVTHIFAVPLLWERTYETAMRVIRERGEKTLHKFEKGVRLGNSLDKLPPLARLFRKVAFREVRGELFGESVCFLITGGSPIRSEALSFFNDIGYHLANGYGMTEIGITSVELSMSARQRNSASIGKPLPSIRYSVDENGELLVKGASIARTVRVGGRLTVRSEDWFRTGDLAVCEGGSYRILGRRDDIILLANGEMLNPNLIEPRFYLPDIRGVCLIDAADDGVAAPTLILSVGRGITKEKLAELTSAVDKRIAECRLEAQIKKVVVTADELLRGNEFKFNRASLAKRFRDGELLPISFDTATSVEAMGELARAVAGMIAAVLGRQAGEIGMDSDFFRELDGTSLDYFALLSALRTTYGLPFEVTEAKGFYTVREICSYIEGA